MERTAIFQKNKDPFRIFDEVQECPEALNSLKYFYEKANE